MGDTSTSCGSFGPRAEWGTETPKRDTGHPESGSDGLGGYGTARADRRWVDLVLKEVRKS